jgi:hypothetical protein
VAFSCIFPTFENSLAHLSGVLCVGGEALPIISSRLIQPDSIIRFALFTTAVTDTHNGRRTHESAKVDRIVQALRQERIDNPTTATRANNLASREAFEYANHIYHGMPIPIQELPHTIRSPQELSNESSYYPELPTTQDFSADCHEPTTQQA